MAVYAEERGAPTLVEAVPAADPAPLGLAAFALTTFVLSFVNAGIVPATVEPVVFGLALAYGGGAQLLAGMWEFTKGNTFGATAFSSYGAFWLSFWAYVTFYAEGVPTENHGVAAGWYLISWAIFTSLMLIAALKTTAVLALLFAVVDVVFILLGLGALTGTAGLTTTGGFVGLVAAAQQHAGLGAAVGPVEREAADGHEHQHDAEDVQEIVELVRKHGPGSSVPGCTRARNLDTSS
jgi:succinate-acetate transporter protein